MKELIERGRLDALDRLGALDQLLIGHIDCDLECRFGGALAGARLQHPELALLDRELEVLHVAVVTLEQPGNAQELVKLPARIRICKGAYSEPPEVAFHDKKDVDANYVQVMQLLLSSGTYHGIATHDPKMIDATHDFVQREGIGKEKFEFQMLFGIRRDLQRQLARDGYNVRIYVPYGKHWYPYFMRRLAERPANVWFVMKNLAKG